MLPLEQKVSIQKQEDVDGDPSACFSSLVCIKGRYVNLSNFLSSTFFSSNIESGSSKNTARWDCLTLFDRFFFLLHISLQVCLVQEGGLASSSEAFGRLFNSLLLCAHMFLIILHWCDKISWRVLIVLHWI